MDISTTYMGIDLKNPIIVSSNKLTATIEDIKKCAAKGAGAVVLKSLFEEQIVTNPAKLETADNQYYWFPEAVEYVNEYAKTKGVQEYLKLIEEAKKETSIPIFASINCTTANEWPAFAKKLEEAGAAGLELNISIFPFTDAMDASKIEERYVEIVKAVKAVVSFPVAVKLGAYFTNPVSMAKKLTEAGADGLVIFNRFVQPDIDLDTEAVVYDNYISSPSEIANSLRWVAILKKEVDCQIAASTGIHCAKGVAKQLLAGADATQICSTLYNNGIEYIETILAELTEWMTAKGYNSIADFKGKLKDDLKFQRVQFLKRTLEA
jgi:dihydroorotate dehydrogenase (fumarate)